MKKIYSILAGLFLTVSVFAQAPNKMSYQAVIRNSSGALVTSTSVGIKISILQGTPAGTVAYSETQTISTNANGLVSLEIGAGTPESGTFDGINWATGPYFIKTETDPTGGTAYTIVGTSELMSVPYALFSANGTPGATGPQGPIGLTGPAGADGQGGVTTAGSGINVTGAGTVASPYVVSTNSPCGLAIGQTYQGGIIFYLDASGCHGLISAPTNQSTGIQWHNGAFIDTYAYGSGLFDGDGNCYRIRNSQGDCASCNAAELCLDLVLGGYSDWYLPSKYELNLMYQNIGGGNALGLGNIGGFAVNVYWSSTEFDNVSAFLQNFSGGGQGNLNKNGSYYVRAVRAF